jgi:phosphate transport system protein
MHALERTRKKRPQHELTRLALNACLIAKDAAHNVMDLLANSNRIAYLAVKDCEKELDQIERRIDEELPRAITQVNESTARELLACLKFITDLERIGDLMAWVGGCVHRAPGEIPGKEAKNLVEMASVVQDMLGQVHQSFVARDAHAAHGILRADLRINHLHQGLMRRHLEGKLKDGGPETLTIVLMAQALERAGDHAKNLAEEVVHMVEGRSIRHTPKRRAHD